MTSILNPQQADLAAPGFSRGDGGRAERRSAAWIWFAVYAAFFVALSLAVGDASRSNPTTTSALFGSLAFLPLNLGAVYWLLRAGRSEQVSLGERAALNLLATMYVCTAIGNTVWAIDEAVRGTDPRYAWANLFYAAAYTFGIAGLSRLPIAPSVATERRKFLLDAACVTLALGALVWTFVVASIDWANVNTLHLAIELMFPVGSIITLALVCRLLMRQGPQAQRSDIVLLAAGVFAQCVMDLLFELDYRQELTRLTAWAALICASVYVVIIYGAQRIVVRSPRQEQRPLYPVLHPMNLLPTVAAISVYVVLIWAAQSGEHRSLGVLVATAIVLNVLFLVKQTISAQENAVLQAARADAESRARYEELAREGQRLESVGRLAGGIAHDFNNLLTTVLANSEFALTRLRPGDAAHAEVTDIHGAALRGAELIRQLLAFGRKSLITPVLLQPDLVLREMERLLQRLAGERHSLAIDLPADLGMVKADRGQLEQVLANLVTNARDAMPDGGPIRVAGRNVSVQAVDATALSLPAGDYVTLSVQDSGDGISADVREHIFEPFFSTKARGKGTGLGLASSYGIMRQSGGGIAVESEVGLGSRFTLYMPRMASGPARAPVATPAMTHVTAAAGSGETILLVEDEAAVRQVTRRMLMAEGYHVLTAADAESARAVFAQHQGEIALLITDVVMPGDSGVTLATTLRVDAPELAVIFISGYSDEALRDGSALPANDLFIQKPFTGAQLLHRIAARLKARRQRIPTAARIP